MPGDPVETHLPVSGLSHPVRLIELGRELLAEARRTNERRLLVLHGERRTCETSCRSLLDALDIGIGNTVVISDREPFPCEIVSPERTTTLMGTTRTIVVVDLHGGTIPNVIGRATGAVDGGGLLVFLSPPLANWPERRDAFDEGLVVEPHTMDDVRGNFKRRLVDTLSDHPGVAIVDAHGHVLRKGLTGGDPPVGYLEPSPPTRESRFPASAYERCLTTDQTRVLEAFERLAANDEIVVVSAERGRGKSSAAGLAAGSLAVAGQRVVVTAPDPANVRALFARAREVLADIDGHEPESTSATASIETSSDGAIVYRAPLEAVAEIKRGAVDVLLVDEAAGVPVATLERFLHADRVGFTTTRHGYEGSAHGFSVRFRETLAGTSHTVTDRRMDTPIRYAIGDPIESWVNRALLLDAEPVVGSAIEGTNPEAVTYHRPAPEGLATDERRLRELLGLLSMAHYRTEPDDLARVLDAPNLEVVTLETGGHVASAALLAREGNLPAERCEAAYAGERLRGNMLPDIFLNVFRDPEVPTIPGLRIVRIATHPAVRRRGLASQLLGAIRDDIGEQVDWLGAGFGATPGLVRFWAENGFVPISLSASRNRSSGSHSVIMLDTHATDRSIFSTYASQLPGRLEASLSDVHRPVDPDVVIEMLSAVPEQGELRIQAAGWRHLAAAADGPGRYDLDPAPARRLAIHHLVRSDGLLSRDQDRLLVSKVLQGHQWETVTGRLGYPSIGECRRSLGGVLSVLVDEYGDEAARSERRSIDRWRRRRSPGEVPVDDVE